MTYNNYDQYFILSNDGYLQTVNDNIFTNDYNNFNNLPFFPIETYSDLKNSENFPIFDIKDTSHNSFNEDENCKENALYYNINEAKRNKTYNINLFQSNKLIHKKRGRKNEFNEKNNISRTHDKFSPDNLRRKIHVHFITFIISFFNEILSSLGYEQKFSKLDYKYIIKNVKKSFFNKIKNKNIGEIISGKISSKYTKKDKNLNYILFQKFKKEQTLNKIFSQSYFLIFKIFYYPSKKTINLKEYGLDMEISLSEDVKMYKDLLEGVDDNSYKNQIINYIKNNFLKNSLFKTK